MMQLPSRTHYISGRRESEGKRTYKTYINTHTVTGADSLDDCAFPHLHARDAGKRKEPAACGVYVCCNATGQLVKSLLLIYATLCIRNCTRVLFSVPRWPVITMDAKIANKTRSAQSIVKISLVMNINLLALSP